MKTRGLAYINHGRWLVDCPACGAPVLINPPEPALCGHCRPDAFAIMFVKRPGKEVYDPIPDQERRTEAKRLSSFKYELPKDWKKIFETLRNRPADKMNWLPGETLKDLKAENARHGISEK